MTWWTQERCDQLRTLWNKDCLSAGYIAQIMNTSRNAVIGKAHRLKLNSRPSPIKQEPLPVNKRTKKFKVYKKTPQGEFEPFNVSLIDMEPGFCYYVTETKPSRYCGHPARGDYCDYHQAIVRPK